MIARGVVLGVALLLGGCSGMEEAEAEADPSKLSAELEARATEIEALADQAVAEVERDAAADLAALKADADTNGRDSSATASLSSDAR